MKNIIKINNKVIRANEYMVVGRTDNKMEMMTNLDPEDLLIFIMPILNELGERFNWFDDSLLCNN